MGFIFLYTSLYVGFLYGCSHRHGNESDYQESLSNT